MNVYELYNSFLVNYNEILQKEIFLKQTVRMQSESVIIKNFNLHHFH